MKQTILIIALSSVFLLVGCSKNYEGEFEIPWGSADDEGQMKRLENNNIPYKVGERHLLIQEESISDATNCCT